MKLIIRCASIFLLIFVGVSSALKANCDAIAQWAKTATPNAARPFIWTAPGSVGYGVIRSTGKLASMSKVRIILRKIAANNKIYYVLTAFPEP